MHVSGDIESCIPTALTKDGVHLAHKGIADRRGAV
jgi:hypothetical protein